MKTSLLNLALVWYSLSVHTAFAHTEKFPTALTIREHSDRFEEKEESHNTHEAHDPEDLEVFNPTDEWQTLKPNQAVPPGSHVRLNMQTGLREAKRGEEEGLKYWTDGQRAQQLKEALKKYKGDNPSKKEAGQADTSTSSQFRSVDELKRDMEALEFLMETDAEIMHKLLSKFNSTSNTVDQRVTALLDLEYLVHQVDNAKNLVSMGGLKLVTDALNNTDVRIQESAAFVLGSAVSSNPTVQIEALEGGALQKLLTLLATPHPVSVKKKALFALACLLRHFPFAQSHFVELGGMQVLGDLFKEQGVDCLRVRIITMLYDMIIEKELVFKTDIEAVPNSTQQQYAKYSLHPMLVEQGWCNLVPELLNSTDHDQREKAVRTLLAMRPHCQTQYQQNPSLTNSLISLQKEYQTLALTEETQGEKDGYFNEILSLLDSLVVKIH
ncbi:nucleotide exchange factor SIL1 isoform X2 [Hoplias malabaricus]|uniref:nucleotide exchange factor SIL1 isoform X2 n=1 Tax=Hoplias malabaricus TaxID=27720 RepID=UPI0034633059